MWHRRPYVFSPACILLAPRGYHEDGSYWGAVVWESSLISIGCKHVARVQRLLPGILSLDFSSIGFFFQG